MWLLGVVALSLTAQALTQVSPVTLPDYTLYNTK